MRALTASQLVDQSDSAFAYPTGSWSLNQTSTSSLGGTQSYSGTNPCAFTYTVPNGVTEVALVFIAWPGGTTITWTVNGANLSTETYRTTALGGLQYVRACKVFSSLSAGDIIRGQSNPSSIFIVDGAIIPSTTPSPVFWVLPPNLATWTGATPASGSTVARNVLADWVKTQTTIYPTLHVIDPMLPPSGIIDVWNEATMIAIDTVHPNDRGHDFLARCVTQSLSSLTFPIACVHV
jgi:hypothetical protein